MSGDKAPVLTQKFDGSGYCNAVVEAIGYITSPDGKDQIDSREIFYPVNIADGSYAIRNYSEVMAYASSSRGFHSKRERMTSVKSRISDIMKNRNIGGAEETAEESSDTGYFIRRQMLGDLSKRIADVTARRAEEAAKKADDGTYKRSTGDDREKAETYSQAEKLDEEAVRSDLAVKADDTPDWETEEGISFFQEKDEVLAKYIIYSHKEQSRTLLLASAGQGKTTILRRIMLYYSQQNCGCFNDDEYDLEIKDKYHLPDVKYVPFLVKLREVSADEQNFNIEKLIVNSIMFFVHNNKRYAEQSDENLREAVVKWFSSVKSNKTPVLLLIDGLDEISDKNKIVFLKSLEKYLSSNGDTRVVLSTRVAGIKSKKILKAFTNMDFSYRSILPFTLDDTKKYAENWIEKTQKKDVQHRYKTALKQVFENAKFLFLRNSMRSPLEVVIILKQIVSNSLSFSRYSIFRDMLWEYLTRHESFEGKNSIYEDRMTILSFLAYKMQINDTLMATEQEIKEYFSSKENLSFHTDIIDNDDIGGSVIRFLDNLVSNANIIETQRVAKDDGDGYEKKYSFPIRAFQEFLCAYACCHIRLTGERVPEPAKLLSGYINDKKWSDVISFALSDIKKSNQQQYDALVSSIITNIEDTEDGLYYIKSLLETEMILNKDQAGLVCIKFFGGIGLSGIKKELFDTCMESESAYALMYHLKANSKQSWQESKENYFEAYARAVVLWNLKINSSLIEEAQSFLLSKSASLNKIGALMLVIACEMMFEENDLRYNEILAGETISRELCDALKSRFDETKDAAFVQGLSSVWFTMLDGSKYAGEILEKDRKCILSVRKALEKNGAQLAILNYLGRDMLKNDTFPWFKRMVYTLGTYPHSSQLRSLWKASKDDFAEDVRTFIDNMYTECKNKGTFDRLTLIFAQMNYGMLKVEDFAYEIGAVIDLRRDILAAKTTEKRPLHLFELVYDRYKGDGAFDSNLFWTALVKNVYELISDKGDEKRYEEALELCNRTLVSYKNPRNSLVSLLNAYILLCQTKNQSADMDTEALKAKTKEAISSILGGSKEMKKMQVLLKLCYYQFVEGNEDKVRSLLASLGDDAKRITERATTLEKLLEQFQGFGLDESISKTSTVKARSVAEFSAAQPSANVGGSSPDSKTQAAIDKLFAEMGDEQMSFLMLILTDDELKQLKKIMVDNAPVGGYKFNC